MEEQPQAQNGFINASSLNSIPWFQQPDSARQWLENVERHARVFHWNDQQKLDIARCRLGPEAQVWETGVTHRVGTWAQFKTAFLERYDVREEELYNRLSNCRQGKRESVRQYADRYQHLVAQLGLTTDGEPTHMYNFLRGLDRQIYQEVYRMKPRTLDQAIQDAIYISEGLAGSGGEEPSRLVPLGSTVPRAQEPPRKTIEVPAAALGGVGAARPEAKDEWGGKRFGDRGPRAPDTPRGRPEHERRGPGYHGRRDGGGPRPAGDRPAVPAGPSAGVGTARLAGKDEVEDLRQQLERLQLTMQQVLGVDANYYTTQQEIPSWEQEDPETASEMEEVYAYRGAPEVYMKRVADFEPMSPPRKRVGAAPGQRAPITNRYTVGVRPAVPATQAPNAPPGQAALHGGPQGYATAQAQQGGGDAGVHHAAAPGGVARPRRVQPIGARTDPVPAEPQEEERRIADDIVAKVNKYALPLSTALRCNAAHIYAKIGARALNIARQQGRNPQGTANAHLGGAEENRGAAGGPAPMVALAADTMPRLQECPQVATAPSPPPATVPRLQVCKTVVKLTNAYGEQMPVTAVIDSGASNTVIPYDTLRKLDLTGSMEETPVTFVNADGNRGQAAGRIRGLQVSLGDMTITLDAFVSRALNYNLLLGTDFLYPVRATLCYDRRQMEYTNDMGRRNTIPINFMRSLHGAASWLQWQREEDASGTESELTETYLHHTDGEAAAVREGAPGSTAGFEHPEEWDDRIAAPGAFPPEPTASQEGASASSEPQDSWGTKLDALRSEASWDEEWRELMRPAFGQEGQVSGDQDPTDTLSTKSTDGQSEYQEEEMRAPPEGVTLPVVTTWGPGAGGHGVAAATGLLYPEEAAGVSTPGTPPEPAPPAALSYIPEEGAAVDPREKEAAYVTRQSPEVHLDIARRNRMEAVELPTRGYLTEELRSALSTAVNQELAPYDRARLQALLEANWDMFAMTNSDLGRTTWATIHIDTGDHAPIAQNPYRMSPKEREAVDQELARMAADGIIEPSTSPWVSPAVLVEKKEGGGTRFCVDMRRVNEVTTTQRYPLGHIADLIDRVAPPAGRTRVYSTLDLKSGYWQVPIADEESKAKTAFATPTSQWQYKVMPMGLKNSAAVFAALMSQVLRPVLGKYALAYLDDIIIYSMGVEEAQYYVELAHPPPTQGKRPTTAPEAEAGCEYEEAEPQLPHPCEDEEESQGGCAPWADGAEYQYEYGYSTPGAEIPSDMEECDNSFAPMCEDEYSPMAAEVPISDNEYGPLPADTPCYEEEYDIPPAEAHLDEDGDGPLHRVTVPRTAPLQLRRLLAGIVTASQDREWGRTSTASHRPAPGRRSTSARMLSMRALWHGRTGMRLRSSRAPLPMWRRHPMSRASASSMTLVGPTPLPQGTQTRRASSCTSREDQRRGAVPVGRALEPYLGGGAAGSPGPPCTC